MNVSQIDIEFLTYNLDPSESNLESLLKGVRTIARTLNTPHVEPTDLEDLVTNTVNSVMLSLPKLSSDTAFSFWLLRVIYNIRVDMIRMKARKKEMVFVEEAIVFHEPKYTFTHDRLRGVAGANFPLVEDLLCGYTMDEVAARHGLTRKAVQQRIYRLRGKQVHNNE